MSMKMRLTYWVFTVIWWAFWICVIGGTFSFLFFRNGQAIPGIIALVVTLALAITLIVTRTLSLARAFAAAEAKRAQRALRARQ
jgi:hypothetical protein